MKVYGIDFSSSPSKKKPIAVAECWLQGSVLGSYSNNELRLSCFHSIESLDLFEEFLSQRGPWVGGLICHLVCLVILLSILTGLLVGIFYKILLLLRQSYQEIFIKWCSTKNYGEKFAYRSTDKASKSSPAMRWVNPPLHG